MNAKKITLIFTVLILFVGNACPQNKEFVFVANWNMENLFDTVDDPGKKDEEFTPNGSKHWTEKRLDLKLRHLAKVVSTMNNGNGPDILGTEEIEHKSLLQRMLNYVKVGKHYGIAYAESPDFRGIDNGLIFNKDIFLLDTVKTIKIRLPSGHPTRYILQAELRLKKNNFKINVFVNHWPSRRGGLERSRPNRIAAAETLKKSLDKLFEKSPDSFVIILGDFNDEPNNYSIHNVLGAKYFECNKPIKGKLFNLAYTVKAEGKGSYKYRNQWNMLDQIIVSKPVVEKNKFNYVCYSFHLVKPVYVIQKYGRYKGAILPTFGGRKYLKGYSDHYPVAAKFEILLN